MFWFGAVRRRPVGQNNIIIDVLRMMLQLQGTRYGVCLTQRYDKIIADSVGAVGERFHCEPRIWPIEWKLGLAAAVTILSAGA